MDLDKSYDYRDYYGWKKVLIRMIDVVFMIGQFFCVLFGLIVGIAALIGISGGIQ